jgi:hypothetical protein
VLRSRISQIHVYNSAFFCPSNQDRIPNAADFDWDLAVTEKSNGKKGITYAVKKTASLPKPLHAVSTAINLYTSPVNISLWHQVALTFYRNASLLSIRHRLMLFFHDSEGIAR